MCIRDSFDRDGEVVGRFELLACEADLLLGAELLAVAHGRTTLIEGLQEPFRDAPPAPALDGGTAGRLAQTLAAGGLEDEEPPQLGGEVLGVAVSEARQVAV